MEIDLNGRFVVCVGETVTVTVTKAKDDYLAKISGIIGAPNWRTQAMITPLSEMRVMDVPSTAGTAFNFTIRFDFKPDAAGAHDDTDSYTVKISGNVSGDAPPDTVIPPPIKMRDYPFITAGKQ